VLRGIYYAASGMLAQQINGDTIANNITNIEAPGYKKDTAVMSPFQRVLLHYIVKEERSQASAVGYTSRGTQVSEVVTSFKQGELKSTGRPLDAAIVGDGFFVVQHEEGIRLTRNGSFKVDAEGYLVTGNGLRVVGENGLIVLNDEDGVSIADDGTIYENGQEVDRLLVVDFADRAVLTKAGENTFMAPDDAQPVQPQYSIRQGYLEMSNVDAAQEMTDLIMMMRIYEANQKAVQTYDRILEQAVREIGSLK